MEKAAALKIERLLVRLRDQKRESKVKKYHFKQQGLKYSLESAPLEITLQIFSYIEKSKLLKPLNRKLLKIQQHASLWRQITFMHQCNEQTTEAVSLRRSQLFANVVTWSTQLVVLNFKYCQHFDERLCDVISLHANSYSLRELYLDGCEKVNDVAL